MFCWRTVREYRYPITLASIHEKKGTAALRRPSSLRNPLPFIVTPDGASWLGSLPTLPQAVQDPPSEAPGPSPVSELQGGVQAFLNQPCKGGPPCRAELLKLAKACRRAAFRPLHFFKPLSASRQHWRAKLRITASSASPAIVWSFTNSCYSIWRPVDFKSVIWHRTGPGGMSESPVPCVRKNRCCRARVDLR